MRYLLFIVLILVGAFAIVQQGRSNQKSLRQAKEQKIKDSVERTIYYLVDSGGQLYKKRRDGKEVD